MFDSWRLQQRLACIRGKENKRNEMKIGLGDAFKTRKTDEILSCEKYMVRTVVAAVNIIFRLCP